MPRKTTTEQTLLADATYSQLVDALACKQGEYSAQVHNTTVDCEVDGVVIVICSTDEPRVRKTPKWDFIEYIPRLDWRNIGFRDGHTVRSYVQADGVERNLLKKASVSLSCTDGWTAVEG
mgnify:CR=1 FL=1